MQVSITEPKGIIWEGNVKEVMLPTEEGEVCVLDFHQSFLMRLKKGVIHLPDRRTAIKDGIAFMKSNSLKIFVET
jgi:F0F1-type ATP synthase epsilon subunit